jgi:hypothetical protein
MAPSELFSQRQLSTLEILNLPDCVVQAAVVVVISEGKLNGISSGGDGLGEHPHTT